MKWLTFVKKENAKKAEELLKQDELASKQSILVKDAKALGIEEEGSFFKIDGDEEGVNKCKELIKEFVEEISEEKLNKAKEEIKKEEDTAAQGIGGIFG